MHFGIGKLAIAHIAQFRSCLFYYTFSPARFFFLFAKYFFLPTILSRQKGRLQSISIPAFQDCASRCPGKTKTYDLLIVLTLLLCSALLPHAHQFRYASRSVDRRMLMSSEIFWFALLTVSVLLCADQPDDDDANYKMANEQLRMAYEIN